MRFSAHEPIFKETKMRTCVDIHLSHTDGQNNEHITYHKIPQILRTYFTCNYSQTNETYNSVSTYKNLSSLTKYFRTHVTKLLILFIRINHDIYVL
jgi:hypothetical protein